MSNTFSLSAWLCEAIICEIVWLCSLAIIVVGLDITSETVTLLITCSFILTTPPTLKCPDCSIMSFSGIQKLYSLVWVCWYRWLSNCGYAFHGSPVLHVWTCWLAFEIICCVLLVCQNTNRSPPSQISLQVSNKTNPSFLSNQIVSKHKVPLSKWVIFHQEWNQHFSAISWTGNFLEFHLT